ncbi:myb/SANT-like DNA-binding domain-containing protein 3 [Saccostrea cucullata]|uniref:myb/SANT-like DNA-binding domain-containing protein 3 n=1 Tax=Saccostrea cuccullata TaxID=36930 RepID=UPI002ED063FD
MATRQKSANFSELEKEILLELIHARKDIIENKQNDGRMVSKKNTEWINIEKEFNSRHGVNKRTIIQLKSLWKNLKARTKSAVAKERRDKRKTGGGPSGKSLDKISSTISEMLPQQIFSLQNPYDDDASLHGDEPEDDNEDSDDNDEILTTNTIQEDAPIMSEESVKPQQPLSCFPGTKRKAAGPGRQDQVKNRLLEIAEIEHKKKMAILQLKEDILKLKKQKLENEIKLSEPKLPVPPTTTYGSTDSNNNCGSFWQPYAQ